MDGFVWRRRARLVAYYDLIHATYWLLVMLFETCALGYKAAYPSPDPADRYFSPMHLLILTYITSYTLDTITTTLWICGVFFSVGVLLWISLRLLRATEFGRDVNQAWREVDELLGEMWPTFSYAFWSLRSDSHFMLHDAVVAYLKGFQLTGLGLSCMEFVLIAAWRIGLYAIVVKFREELRVRNLQLQVAGRRAERIRGPEN